MSNNFKIVKGKTQKLKLNTEMKNLNEDQKELLKLYISSGYEIIPYVKQKKSKNDTPEKEIIKHITKTDIISYIKKHDPDGIAEHDKQNYSNYMNVKKWFLNKYPNFITDKLKEIEENKQ